MVRSIFRTYFLLGVIIYILFVLTISGDLTGIHIFNISVFLAYSFLLYYSINGINYNSKNLIILVSAYSVFIVAMFKFLSFIYNGNLFVFSEVDALHYHNESLEMIKRSFAEGIIYIYNIWSLEDLGAVLITSTLYRIVNSPLILNLFYVIIGVITAVKMFNIGQRIMSPRYAFLAALTFSISSMTLFFHSTNLKESIMVFLVVSFYDTYLRFLEKRHIKYFLYALLWAATFIFFRPAIIFFIAVSVFISFLIEKRKGIKGTIAIIALFIIFIYFYSEFQKIYNNYTRAGNIEMVIASKEKQGAIKSGGLAFNYSVNILAQILGPFPTFTPAKGIKISFWSSGLFLRSLLFLPFWLGVYFALKTKHPYLYPLFLFVIFEMISLSLILEGLELRKAMPHMPFVFIVAFWFLSEIDLTKEIINRIFFKRLIILSFIFVFVAVVAYNFR